MKTLPVALTALALALSACASRPPPSTGLFVRAHAVPDPPVPSPVVVQWPAAANPVAQFKPMPTAPKVTRPASAQQVVLDANHKAAAAPD